MRYPLNSPTCNPCAEIPLSMMTEVISMHEVARGWYVMWGILGYDDYKRIVKPWCDANLEHEVSFEASSSVLCATEADALLLYMRFK